MSDLPDGFVADLRHAEPWPEIEGSLWRHPELVRQTYGHLTQVVSGLVDPPPRAVLDVGSGAGYLALELARQGYHVVGIDADASSIDLARRSLDADPDLRGNGMLRYEAAAVEEFAAPPQSFDIIVVSRMLHHVDDVDDAVRAMHGWLRPGGQLVCVDFGYDRFDDRSARWLYETGGLLAAAGIFEPTEPLGDDLDTGIERILRSWWREHTEEHVLNTFDEILDPLRASFTEVTFAPVPYLYWEVLEQLSDRALAPGEIGQFLARLEADLLRQSELPTLLFSWTGRPRQTTNGGHS